MGRISREELFMRAAELFALRSTCLRGHVGCVAVVNGRIVASGYNGAPPGMPQCDEVGCGGGEPTIRDIQAAQFGGLPDNELKFPNGCTRATHAEANVVAFAARVGASLIDSHIYTTHACCANCAALLVACGVSKVTYLTPYRLTAGVELLDKANVEVVQYER